MNGNSNTRPLLPIEQSTYYILSIISTLLIISTFFQGVSLDNPPLFGTILAALILVLIVITGGHNMREKNPWVNYSKFLRNKEANLADCLENTKTGLEVYKKIYRKNLRKFIADLQQFRTIALSENKIELADDILSQIDHWQNVLAKVDF